MFEAVPELVRHYAKLLQPADGVLHHHSLTGELPVEGLLLTRELLSLYASFTSSRAPPLVRHMHIQLGVIVLYPVVAQIQPQTHHIR